MHEHMVLRTCTPDDLALLREWDPYHQMWAKEYVVPTQIEYRTYIGERDYPFKPMAWGQIKFDHEEYILSWFVETSYRRLGFGTKMAKLLADMAGRPIKAKINIHRPYSERIAINIGLVPGHMHGEEKWWRSE